MKNCLNKLFQQTICGLFGCCGAFFAQFNVKTEPVCADNTTQRGKKNLISTPVLHTNLEMKPFILEQYLHSGPIVTINVHLLFCVVSIGRAKTEGLENLYLVHKTAGRSNSHLNGAFQFRATMSFVSPRTQRVKK